MVVTFIWSKANIQVVTLFCLFDVYEEHIHSPFLAKGNGTLGFVSGQIGFTDIVSCELESIHLRLLHQSNGSVLIELCLL